ncbi:MAG TPA: ribonuclease HII [Salinivirgaceae bacterium]|mgnify:FL=1|nr:ribonuclease HII [Salinivirgaceae bacterium]HQA76213.1 ribonuclease HII [Salinivirgaceae bacterium]
MSTIRQENSILKESYSGFTFEVGCDEAGRGCLAGPVVAAAVIIPNDFNHPFLNDSKQLSQKQREEVRNFIEQNAIDYAVAFVDRETIDKINILNASILCMHRALDMLKIRPEFIIVDGNRFKSYGEIKHKTIIKGDTRFKSIAAASILAKTARDRFMEKIALEYPEYLWDKNRGYPTVKHREAIKQYGITKYHRRSFKLLDNQLKIEF